MEDYKKCIIGTHLYDDRVLPGPIHEYVKDYLESVPHNLVNLYNGEPPLEGRTKGKWLINSKGGEIGREDREEILSEFNIIHMIGRWWGACHNNTWRELIEGVYNRDEDYTILMPSQCIADGQEKLSETLYGENKIVDDKMDRYRDPLKTERTEEKVKYEWTICHPSEHAMIVWSLGNGREMKNAQELAEELNLEGYDHTFFNG